MLNDDCGQLPSSYANDSSPEKKDPQRDHCGPLSCEDLLSPRPALLPLRRNLLPAQGRNDQGSSPCSRPLQSHGRTSPARPNFRRLRPAREAGSCEPKMRSTRVPVHLSSPVLRSRPSNTSAASETAFHSVPMSSRLTKKSLVSASGRLVKTPCFVRPKLVFRTRRPPTSTVISGAVSVSNCALSTSNASADTLHLPLR